MVSKSKYLNNNFQKKRICILNKSVNFLKSRQEPCNAFKTRQLEWHKEKKLKLCSHTKPSFGITNNFRSTYKSSAIKNIVNSISFHSRASREKSIKTKIKPTIKKQKLVLVSKSENLNKNLKEKRTCILNKSINFNKSRQDPCIAIKNRQLTSNKEKSLKLVSQSMSSFGKNSYFRSSAIKVFVNPVSCHSMASRDTLVKTKIKPTI